MSHMVIYRGADGKPGYHQTDDIHDAVIYVEGLRNEKDVDHARIFRLEEVIFEYKPYYRVELKVGSAAVTSGNGDETDTERSDEDEVLDTTEVSDDAETGGEATAEETDDEGAPPDSDASDEDTSDDDLEDSTSTGARRGLFGR